MTWFSPPGSSRADRESDNAVVHRIGVNAGEHRGPGYLLAICRVYTERPGGRPPDQRLPTRLAVRSSSAA